MCGVFFFFVMKSYILSFPSQIQMQEMGAAVSEGVAFSALSYYLPYVFSHPLISFIFRNMWEE